MTTDHILEGNIVLNGGRPDPMLVHTSSKGNQVLGLQAELQAAQDLNVRYDEVLRSLAFYLSVGGYNSDGLIVPEVAEDKIRWGIDHLFRVGQAQGHVLATPPVAWLYEARSRLEPDAKRISFYRRGLNSAMWDEKALYKIRQTGEDQPPSAWLYTHPKGEDISHIRKAALPAGMRESPLFAAAAVLGGGGTR